MQEKRKYQRIHQDFSIVCKVFKRVETDSYAFRIIDISIGGLSFLGSDLFTKDDLLQIILRIPPTFKDKIEVFGRIVDSQKTEDNLFKTHVALIDISPLTRAALSGMIEQFNLQKTLRQP